MVSISGSAHLQGRQWVDMSGWSEGSEDKGEVCVRCEGVGGVGWGLQGSGNLISHVELGGNHKNSDLHVTHVPAHTHHMQITNATPAIPTHTCTPHARARAHTHTHTTTSCGYKN